MPWIIFIILFSHCFLYTQNIILNPTNDILDPVKKTQWRVFYQNNNNVNIGDGNIVVLVNHDGDSNTPEIQLTPDIANYVGAIWYDKPISLSACSSWNATFEFRAWGSTSLNPDNGIVFAFLKNIPYNYISSSRLGIPINNQGFAIIYDTWANIVQNNNKVPIIEIQEINTTNDYKETLISNNGISYIPNNRGIAIGIGSHNILRNDKYVKFKVIYNQGIINLSYSIPLSNGGYNEIPLATHKLSQEYLFPGYLYFSASTSGSNENHSIKNVEIKLEKKTIINNTKTSFLCKGSSINLDAGIGFNTYEWKKIGSSTIIGTNQFLNNVSQTGVYTVSKTSFCNNVIDTIRVENFGTTNNNPITSQVDNIIYNPITGNEILEVYLCGNETKKLNINEDNAYEIRWFRNNILINVNKSINLNTSGNYKVEIEYRTSNGSSCTQEYLFPGYLFQNIFEY